jgi:large subunit ribosomal protein L11
MAGKPVTATLKMKLRGGQASAAPPVGSTLGQYGVNMMDFINPFNDQTKDLMGQELTVHIFIHEDKSMTWRIVGTPTDVLILEELGIKKGSGNPNSEKLPEKLTDTMITKIAKIKMKDMNTNRLESVKRMVAGTARSMGIELTK